MSTLQVSLELGERHSRPLFAGQLRDQQNGQPYCSFSGLSRHNPTPALRRRELAIARQLVAVGATAREAEAYAREAGGQAGRFAAVDLRSYERERLGWQARRQGAQASLARRIDRTGQPPAGVSGSMQAGALVRGLFGGQP